MKRPAQPSLKNCSIARAVDQIGDRWSILILREVFLGSRRFGQFCDVLGIARNLLAERLDRLIENGLLEKYPLPEEPHRQGYRLTEKGFDAYPILLAFMQWGDAWLSGEKGPPVLLNDTQTGDRVVALQPVTENGGIVPLRNIAGTPGPGAESQTRQRYEGLAERRARRAQTS